MFAVLYSFEVKQDQEEKFKYAWTEMTKLIYQHEGSLGSRLHQDKNGLYLAYAQWPNRSSWENAGSRLPAKADELRAQMRESCSQINTVYEMDVFKDLLFDEPMKKAD